MAHGDTVSLINPTDLTNTIGQQTAAKSLPVVLASDQVDTITAGADGTSNTSNRLAVADHLKIFNGTTWDRARTAVSDAMAATGLLASGMMGYNGATWDRLRVDANKNLQIAASSKGYGSGLISVTRTNDTNVYAAADVLGPATGSTAAITFPTMGPSGGGEIMITSAVFERDTTALISGETSYTLYLYSITPPSALGDNVAWDLPSGDRASFLGKISLGTPVDLGSTLYVEQNGINKQVTLASGSLFGYLVTDGTYTPTASAVHRIGLHAVAV